MNVPSLYRLSTELQVLLEDDTRPWEEVEAELNRLLPVLEHKAAHVARASEWLDDLAGAIKAREKQVVEARKAMEAKAENLRGYLLRCMRFAGATEIVDRETGIRIREVANPAHVVVDDERLIPKDFLRYPDPPPPSPDKRLIADALKEGFPVPGCRLEQSTRLKIT